MFKRLAEMFAAALLALTLGIVATPASEAASLNTMTTSHVSVTTKHIKHKTKHKIKRVFKRVDPLYMEVMVMSHKKSRDAFQPYNLHMSMEKRFQRTAKAYHTTPAYESDVYMCFAKAHVPAHKSIKRMSKAELRRADWLSDCIDSQMDIHFPVKKHKTKK